MSAKDIIDARPETIGSLITFSSTPQVISVPTYQRSYKWDASRVIDILKLSDPDDTSFGFIGTMVFVRNHEQGLEVVDGQQRLISIVLVLCAFRDFLNEMLEQTSDDATKEMLREMSRDIQKENLLDSKSYSSVEQKPRISFSRSTYDVFKHIYLLGESNFEPEDEVAEKELKILKKNYKVAKDYLHEKYDSPSKSLISLLNMRIEKLKGLVVNVIYISKQEFAGEVFESINGTGVTLKLSELVKNYIFRNINISTAERKWNEITANCDYNSDLIETIIKYDWQNKYDITDDFEIFRSIRSNTDDVEAYCSRLLRISKLLSFYTHPSSERFKYLRIDDNSNDKNHIIKLAATLKLLKAKQFLRLMIVTDELREHLTIKQHIKLLELITNFQVRVKITGVGSNHIDSLYSSSAKTMIKIGSQIKSGDIPKSKASDRITTEMFDRLFAAFNKLTSDEEFVEAFSRYERTKSTNKDIFKYLLSKIENHLQRKELIIDVLDNRITLEEVYPQTPSIGWQEADCTAEDTYKIGNATILIGKDNRMASNAVIEDKLEVYKLSNLKLNTELIDLINLEKPKWSKEKVSDRGSLLAQQAAQIWKL